jgi:hypothetical protein
MAVRSDASEVEEERCESALRLVEVLPSDLDAVLASGRRYSIEAGADSDQLTIRGRGGQVLLRVEVTEAGPVLRFDSAAIELTAARTLSLHAERLDIRARGDVDVDVGGALREHVGGDYHARVDGAARVEAAAVELQASEGRVALRAMKSIHLDGEHIGLNDDPLPAPFPWSAIAEDGGA